MKILVTGGCGFIGSNFIERCLKNTKNLKIVNVDALLTGSNKKNLEKINNSNYKFVKGNICDKKLMGKLISNADCIVNFAAESHVDRSIKSSANFVKSNIIGINTILDILKENKKTRLIQVSTDEVYGETLKGSFNEHDELNPSNPYSATKASAEMMIKSYVRTFGINAVITRCTNNYGPKQFPEKLIPKTIICALKNLPIPIHGKGNSKRQWIHVQDHCDAIYKIMNKKNKSLVYNVNGNFEASNIEVVKIVLRIMKKSEDLITYVQDRPGQDRRYAINGNLIKREYGFEPKIGFEKGIQETVEWYLKNQTWWKKISFKRIKNPTPWIK